MASSAARVLPAVESPLISTNRVPVPVAAAAKVARSPSGARSVSRVTYVGSPVVASRAVRSCPVCSRVIGRCTPNAAQSTNPATTGQPAPGPVTA